MSNKTERILYSPENFPLDYPTPDGKFGDIDSKFGVIDLVPGENDVPEGFFDFLRSKRELGFLATLCGAIALVEPEVQTELGPRNLTEIATAIGEIVEPPAGRRKRHPVEVDSLEIKPHDL